MADLVADMTVTEVDEVAHIDQTVFHNLALCA